MSSSILSVAIGSRAEHGSSMRMTSGSTAMVRAMHSRCCWPPESPMPGWLRRSLTSSHSPAPRSDCSTRSRVSPRSAAEAQARGDVVEDRHGRERVGLLEDHPDGAPHADDVDARVVEVEVVEAHLAGGARPRDLLVHAVDAAHERRLAAARGPDHGGHAVGRVVEVDLLDRVGLAVERAELAQRDRVALRGRRRRGGVLRPSRRPGWWGRLPVMSLGSVGAAVRSSGVMRGGSFVARGVPPGSRAGRARPA